MSLLVRLSFAALLAAPTAAAAQPRAFVIDRAHSQINFVAEARLVSAHGFFGTWEADLQLDPTAPENSKVAITIDAASINTRVERRDGHLRSKDFFFVDSFPKITFVATGINKLSETKFNITGDLTIRGVTKTVVAPTTLVFYDTNRGDGRVKGTFSINRRDFGVSYNSVANPIEDDVLVQFDIHMQDKEKAEAARQRRGS